MLTHWDKLFLHITSTYFVSYKNYVSIHIIKIVNYLYCMGFDENNILRLMTDAMLFIKGDVCNYIELDAT